VAGGDALVAEDPTDLKHPVEPAHLNKESKTKRGKKKRKKRKEKKNSFFCWLIFSGSPHKGASAAF